MKKLLSIFIVSQLIITTTYAFSTRQEWDCTNITYLTSIQPLISNLFNDIPDSKTLVNIAISNLEKYCNYDTKVLQTPDFLNHLLDVYFRYLDWIKTNNYSGPLYKKSVLYRKQLNKIAEQNFKNTNPDIVNSLYKDFTQNIWPKYIEFCKKIPQINNLLTKSSLDSEPKINNTTFWQDYCYQLSELRLSQEINLLNMIQDKIYYTNWDNETFSLFKAFASQWNNLLNLFIISLWDFDYLVNRFIKVTDANTK